MFSLLFHQYKNPLNKNGTNFDAHVSHKSPNKVKWKHTTVELFVFAWFLQVNCTCYFVSTLNL